MQRAQAIVLVLALFAAPLALLARASSGLGGACNNLCCLRHGTHAGHTPESKEGRMACHHGEAGHAMYCSMKTGHDPMDFGFLAPLAPTTPSSSVSLVLPIRIRTAIAQSLDSLPAGFFAAPFEPPRS
jgi:hypothetical protein